MANCPVCGNKIAFMEGYGFYNQSICFDCHKLTDTDFVSSLSAQAIKEKLEGIDAKLGRRGISEKTRTDLLHVQGVLLEAFDEQSQIEKERYESDENIKGFHISTLSSCPGYAIRQSLGFVYINSKEENIAINDYNEWVSDCMKHLSKKAYDMGANAILDLHILQQGSYIDNCLFYGTAVILENENPQRRD